MATGKMTTSRGIKDMKCSDCGKKIGKGDRYIRMSDGKKYCESCKKFHKRKKYDYEGMVYDMMSKPLFNEELNELFPASKRQHIISQLTRGQYPVRKLSYTFRSCSVRLKTRRNKGDKHFIIFYIEGYEANALVRIFDRYPHEFKVHGRKLVKLLLNGSIPDSLITREHISNIAKKNEKIFIKITPLLEKDGEKT